MLRSLGRLSPAPLYSELSVGSGENIAFANILSIQFILVGLKNVLIVRLLF